MKLSFLIIGLILFLVGVFTGRKFFLATGIIFAIVSFFEKKLKKEKKLLHRQKRIFTTRKICPNCGEEMFSTDNYCPECGKKVLP